MIINSNLSKMKKILSNLFTRKTIETVLGEFSNTLHGEFGAKRFKLAVLLNSENKISHRIKRQYNLAKP